METLEIPQENQHKTIRSLTELLPIQHPIIMAPMFLVSNVDMLRAAAHSGITGAIPALNYRTIEEFKKGLSELKATCSGPFGINLIVNQSNPLLEKQLEACLEAKVDYIITSLGSPRKVIETAHKLGILVFCDVVDLATALKVQEMGADAVIAVTNKAGGHAGPSSPEQLIPDLVNALKIPVIAAGGVANKTHVDAYLKMGAIGCSVGTVFIASTECGVSEEYKQACVTYKAKDVVMTTRLSGTPCTVINTPYVQSIGTSSSWIERLLNRHKKLKKWVKMWVFFKGMKQLQKAAYAATYKTVWCAGPSIEHITAIKLVKEIVADLTE